MPDLLVLFLAACGTAAGDGGGAAPVWLLGQRAAALTAVDFLRAWRSAPPTPWSLDLLLGV
jgi:hypothetical protein